MSVDPLAEKYPNINAYAYCAQNPVNLIDPNGKDIEPARNQAGSIKQAIQQWKENGITTIQQIKDFVINYLMY